MRPTILRPIWQAQSCARITLAPRLPLKVTEGTEKNPLTFLSSFLYLCVSATQMHTLSFFKYVVCFALLFSLSFLFLCVTFVCKQILLCMCVTECLCNQPPLSSSHWHNPCLCWHSLTDGAQRSFSCLQKNLHCNHQWLPEWALSCCTFSLFPLIFIFFNDLFF